MGDVPGRMGRYAWAWIWRFGEGRRMSNRSREVDRFMEELDHPLKDGIERLRAAILDSSDRITENIKWKAPSFRYADEDRVTFRLYPEDRVQLIFHRGAKVRSDAADFAFEDHTGLFRWVANDRAVVALHNAEDVDAKLPALVEVVNRWVVA